MREMRQQIKAIVEILTELEMMQSESLGRPCWALLRLCADLGKAPSAEEIDEACKAIFVRGLKVWLR
jgi:hypothetical protein